MPETSHDFGGDWTTEKLERVGEYLRAYTKALKNTSFNLVYIDAFAGTGYRTLRRDDSHSELMFPELTEDEPKLFLDGSARIALQYPFHQYVFIEKDAERFRELEKLQSDFPQRNITLLNQDANDYLQRWCKQGRWGHQRAVLFLDPYGMQVEWQTLEAIARTQAIDLWLLFPLGIAVNRLLRRDGNIDPAIRDTLNRLFGTNDWYDAFYQVSPQRTLFGSGTEMQKVADFNRIAQYMVARLETIFAGVAKNPLRLCNLRNNPLYLLCFAVGNPRGKDIAIRIAQHILKPR